MGLEKKNCNDRSSKEKMLFVCQWGKNPETSWSGTDYAVYSRLSNYYDLKNYDTGLRNPYAFSQKVLFKLKFISRMKMERNIEEHFGKVLNKKYSYEIPAFQTIKTYAHQENRRTFVYEDLSTFNVLDLIEHNSTAFKVSEHEDFSLNDLKLYSAIKKKDYNNPKTIFFTMGKWIRKWLIEQEGIPQWKVFHVGGGFNIDPLKINHNSDGKTFLFVGKNEIRKDLKLVIEAFELLYQEDHSLKLIVAGPEKKTNPEPGVIYKGLVGFEELTSLFNQSDIFVMPSLFEAYGLVFAEALTYGLPAIGRDAYEMPYFIEEGKTGLLLRNEDPGELASLMRKTINSESMKQNVFNKQSFYLHEYNWDTVVERMVKVIDYYIALDKGSESHEKGL